MSSNLIVQAAGSTPNAVVARDTGLAVYALMHDAASGDTKAVRLATADNPSFSVKTAAGNVALAVDSDGVIVKKTVGGATAVTLPADPVKGQKVLIVDGKGDAAANNITIAGEDGETINGAANYVISRAYGAVLFIFNGVEWNVASEAAAFASLESDLDAAEATAELNYFKASTRVVSGLVPSIGGNITKDLYDFDLSAGGVLIDGLYAYFAALNDTVLIGAGAWAKSYDLSGAPAVVLSADGKAYYMTLVAIKHNSTIALHAVFGAEAASGAAVKPTPAAVLSSLVDAGAMVAGDKMMIIGQVLVNRAAVDTMSYTVVDGATDATLGGYRNQGRSDCIAA